MILLELVGVVASVFSLALAITRPNANYYQPYLIAVLCFLVFNTASLVLDLLEKYRKREA